MNRNRMNLRIFDNDTNIIDRTGAESLIPIQESNEIIQGVVTQSAVLQRGRKLPNMTSRQYKMPVLDMLPIAYFVNGDTGQKKTTKQAWDKKFITAEEIAVIVPIPEAVLDDSDYDIVMGGVANDKVFNTVELYFDQLIDKNEAISRLKYEKPNMQICFRTEESLEHLHYERSFEV